MKIGLLTVHYCDYGSFYQAMALYSQLEKLGHDVELISESYLYLKKPKLFLSHIMRLYSPKWFSQILRQRVAVYNTYCILEKDLASLKIARPNQLSRSNYDCVIIGSDELWSFTNPKIGYIKLHFGIDIFPPHISYATSGISLNQEKAAIHNRRRQIVAGLKTFAWLSARDDVTKQWVEQWSGKPCKKVLDPTLLNPCFVQQSEQKNVIVVYGEHFSAQQQAAIIHFAEKENMPLQAIAWRHSWCDSFLEANRGEDVQAAFAGAAYCISSTFHGTIFSILAHKPFTSFVTQERGRKVRCLLKDLMLEDRIFEEGSGINQKEIDYAAVEKILQEKRCISLQYLKHALADCEKVRGHAV